MKRLLKPIALLVAIGFSPGANGQTDVSREKWTSSTETGIPVGLPVYASAAEAGARAVDTRVLDSADFPSEDGEITVFLNQEDLRLVNQNGAALPANATIASKLENLTLRITNDGQVIDNPAVRPVGGNPKVVSISWPDDSDSRDYELQARLCGGVGLNVALFVSTETPVRMDPGEAIDLKYDVVVQNLPADVCNATDVIIALSFPGQGFVRVPLGKLADMSDDFTIERRSADPLNPTEGIDISGGSVSDDGAVSTKGLARNMIRRGESFRFTNVRFDRATSGGALEPDPSAGSAPNIDMSKIRIQTSGDEATVKTLWNNGAALLRVESGFGSSAAEINLVDRPFDNSLLIPPGDYEIASPKLPVLSSGPDSDRLLLGKPSLGTLGSLDPKCHDDVLNLVARAWFQGNVATLRGGAEGMRTLATPLVVPAMSLEVECLDEPVMSDHPMTYELEVVNRGATFLHELQVEDVERGGAQLMEPLFPSGGGAQLPAGATLFQLVHGIEEIKTLQELRAHYRAKINELEIWLGQDQQALRDAVGLPPGWGVRLDVEVMAPSAFAEPFLTRTFEASAADPCPLPNEPGRPVLAQADSRCEVDLMPDLRLGLDCPATEPLEHGAVATFEGTITNPGDTTLTVFRLNFDRALADGADFIEVEGANGAREIPVGSLAGADANAVDIPADGLAGSNFVTLESGQSATFRANFIVPEDCCELRVTGKVQGALVGYEATENAVDLTTAICPVSFQPSLVVEKTMCPDELVSPGEEVVYYGKVTNAGDVTLYDVHVSTRLLFGADTTGVGVDPQNPRHPRILAKALTTLKGDGSDELGATMLGVNSGLILAPGETQEFSVTYVAPNDDFCGWDMLEAGGFVLCNGNGIGAVPYVSQCEIERDPKLGSFVRWPHGGPAGVLAGQTVQVPWVVRNVGDVVIHNVELQGSAEGGNSEVLTASLKKMENQLVRLAPGEEVVSDIEVTIGDDGSCCRVLTRLEARAQDLWSEEALLASASTVLELDTNPVIAINLTCVEPREDGDWLFYEGSVINNGDVTLTDVSARYRIEDAPDGSETVIFESLQLAPDEEETFKLEIAQTGTRTPTVTVSARGVDNCVVASRGGAGVVTDEARCPALPVLEGNGVVFDPGSGSYYEVVDGEFSWVQARSDASARQFNGIVGRLATINDASENAFIGELVQTTAANPAHSYWIGGAQRAGSAEPVEGWEWISEEAFEFTNWAPGEPQNVAIGGDSEEHLGAFLEADELVWIDLSDSVSRAGYVVEYDPGMIYNPRNGSYYAIGDGRFTWTEAREQAQSFQFAGGVGHLATIQDETENDFVRDLITNQASEAGVSHWLGGFQAADGAEPGEGWGWTTGESFGFTAWAPGEPQNSAIGGAEEDELGGFVQNGELGWIDLSDGINKNPFVVELEPAVIRNPANGHFYETVSGSVSWTEAALDARSRSYLGLQGSLATITSIEENRYIADLIRRVSNSTDSTYWIGGSRPDGSSEPSGGWRWLSGEPFEFTHWGAGEPQNAAVGGAPENYLGAFLSEGSLQWIDLSDEVSQGGFVIEYSPLRITNWRLVAGGIHLRLPARPGSTYLIESADRIGSPWRVVNSVETDDAEAFAEAVVPVSGSQLLRVRSVPKDDSAQ